MAASRQARFPLGHALSLHELAHDPYPVYARLQSNEPISWVPALNMWLVVGYEDVRAALLDCPQLTTASVHSTIFDTFGAQVLTTEGEMHDRYRKATRHAFTPKFVKEHLEPAIAAAAASLIAGFAGHGFADLRAAFAARLPVQIMLVLCGLPAEDEARMRRWYDSFEAALANFTGDSLIRETARRSVAEFHARLDNAIDAVAPATVDYSLLAHLVHAPVADRLSNEEIKRNLSIIFFGGLLPDKFDLDRKNCRRHFGFATGTHACLGSHLAKTEARIGLAALLDGLAGVQLDRTRSEPPSGYEFRQPRRLTVSWERT